MRITTSIVILTLLSLAVGCQRGAAPVVPMATPSASESESTSDLAPLGMWRLAIDGTSLEAEATYLPDRIASEQGDAFLLPLNRFITASTFELLEVGREDDQLQVTYRVTHPFAAPSDPSAAATATNRADLGFAGVVLFLADVESAEGQTFFDDVVANTSLVANADAYWQPGGMIARTGSMTANCFPGLNVVDESGTGNRVGISNGGNPTGNFGTNGWTRSDLGDAPFTGWTGYGVLHQGQAADRTVSINLGTEASISLDVALIAKYTDPRGESTPSEKQANRLPSKPADFTKFAYRMPHGALDVSSCRVGEPSGPLTGGIASEITMRCEVLDWDAEASVSTAPSLAEEPDLSLVLASAPGAPALMLDVPGVMSGPALGVQQASGGISHEYLFTIGLEDTQNPAAGRYAGLVRMTDPEAAFLPPPTQALDEQLHPLTEGLPLPITYQACVIEVQSGSWAAQFHLAPSLPTDNAYANPTHLLVDRAGNTYVQGGFQGVVNFAPELTGGTIPSVDMDTFVLSLSPDGAPRWVVRWPYEQLGASMALSSDESTLFCVSSISEQCDLDPGPGTDIRIPNPNASSTAAIATLSTSDGRYVWGHAWVAPASSRLSDVVVSETTNDLLLPINSANGTIDMDPGPGTVNVQTGSQRLVLLGLDQSGTFRWFTQLQPVDYGYCFVSDIDVAPTGLIVVGGHFTNSVDFNPGPEIELRTAVGADPYWPADDYVLALDSSGRFVWVSILTGSGDNAAVNELLVTPADAIVVHGRFAGTLDCDPSTEVFELQSGVHAEPFFLCLNDQGGLVWAGKTSRLTGPGEMVCDAMNRLWIPMAWNLDSEDLDPTMGEWTQDPLGKSNSILLTLDADTGVILEHRRVQSSWPGFARLGALALAPSNQSIRWGGGFGDAPLDVDPGPGTKLLTPPNEGSHGLVLRLNPDGSW